MSTNTNTTKRLARSNYTVSQQSTIYDATGKPIVSGYRPNLSDDYTNQNYHQIIKICRRYYKFDPIASTVINRMADMAITKLRHRRRHGFNSKPVAPEVLDYFTAIGKKLQPLLNHMATEYLINGMAVPAYELDKVRGDLVTQSLGRKRVWVPINLWVRNPSNLTLHKKPTSMERRVFLNIPPEDVHFVQNKGRYQDGAVDLAAYRELLELAPDYVAAILRGETKILIEDAYPILRKLTSDEIYPQPFLTAALKALDHKEYLKMMDRSIAARAIEAVRHITVGSDEFPAIDDDIEDTKNSLYNSSGDRIFNWFTNHTVTMKWIYPPLDLLINEAKYAEPNADIFLAMGFPRVLTVGETLRSNSSDASIASLGPKATLEDMRVAMLLWVEKLYTDLAEKNGFDTYPEPTFAPITVTDMTTLVQFSIQALAAGAISKDTVAQLFETNWDDESAQIKIEQESGVLSPVEVQQEKNIEQQRINQENIQKQQEQQNNNNDRGKDTNNQEDQ